MEESPNGKVLDSVAEDDETLIVAQKNIRELGRADGTFTTLGRNQLSVLKQFAHVPDTDAEKAWLQLLPLADFKDDAEWWEHYRSFCQCKKWGLDLWKNVAALEGLCGTNRGGRKTTRAAAIINALKHSTFPSNVAPAKGQRKEKSPISE